MGSCSKIVFSRSPLDIGPRVILFILTCIAVPIITAQVPTTVQHIDLGETVGLGLSFNLPLFGLLPLMLLASIAHSLFNYRYIICDDYLLEVDGILNFALKTTRINFLRINVIEIDQNFYQRLFNTGNILLSTAVTQGDGMIVMRGISNPRNCKDLIQERINYHASIANTPTANFE